MGRRSDEVARWVKKQGRAVSVSEIADGVGSTHGQTLGTVIHLVERGELLDQGGGMIASPPSKWDEPRTKCPPTQRRIWEAACYHNMKGPWTAKDLALTAEATRDYVRDYLRWLVEQGHVITQIRPGKGNIYRLHPDAPGLGQPPIWTNQKNRTLRRRKAEG